MLDRCYNKNSIGYQNYGGRGISVCAEWKKSFTAFLQELGEKPNDKLSLDRINNDGNYEPGNVRWATRAQQLANRRPYRKRAKM
jgi:hypothetical protein